MALTTVFPIIVLMLSLFLMQSTLSKNSRSNRKPVRIRVEKNKRKSVR